MLRRTNLLPEGIQQDIEQRKLKLSMAMIACVAIVFGIIVHFVLGFQVAMLEETLDDYINQSEDAEFGRLSRDMKLLNEKKDLFVEYNGMFLELIDRRFPIVNMLRFVGSIAQDKVWLTKFTVSGDGNLCELNGRSQSTHVVSEFMMKLKKMGCFENVSLVSMGKGNQADDIVFSLA